LNTSADFELILVEPQEALCSTFREYFQESPQVKIVNGRFQSLAVFDCMVSPANSFGLMDGGVDAAITDFFGYQLMRNVQEAILQDYLGEQPVGTSIIVETGHSKHSYLAHSPTMRVPMDIAHTDNVYLAMFAMLRAVYHHNRNSKPRISTVACPGLGTGAGKVPFREAARQMALAYTNFLNPPSYIDWTYADRRQGEIRYGGDLGLHLPPLR
jgi:O-acetyl-ADP-ribose deacetylase (regulator of RNase III)